MGQSICNFSESLGDVPLRAIVDRHDDRSYFSLTRLAGRLYDICNLRRQLLFQKELGVAVPAWTETSLCLIRSSPAGTCIASRAHPMAFARRQANVIVFEPQPSCDPPSI